MTDHTNQPELPISLDGYWRGDFTLRQDETGYQERTSAPLPPLPIEQLAAPDLTIRGRNLAVLLAPVYRALTS